jgi:hypothetical protein
MFFGYGIKGINIMTNIAIDSNLLIEALCEFIIRRKQLEIIKLFGKFDSDSDYDYKKSRK